MKLNAYLILIAVLFIGGCTPNVNEEAAIKKLLETESATWRSGDYKAHAACWHIQPYSRILVSLPDGSTYDVPPETMTQPSDNMGKGGAAVNSNYKMKINGSTAWVSHNEASTATDGFKTHSYEMRMIEKIAGEWKLVGQSIHIYQLK